MPIIAQNIPLPPTAISPPAIAASLNIYDFVQFITKLNGNINLCGIIEGQPVVSLTLQSASEAVAKINELNAQHYNCYFTANKVRSGTMTKPKKTDIVDVTFAHVDIDPPHNLDVAAVQLWKQGLRANVPQLIAAYKPSIIVWSGNGLQLFWKHEVALPIEAGEQINKTLIALFDGDTGTHNADRLMRLPATLNYPTAAKIKKGYSSEPVSAELLYINEGPTFQAALFPKPSVVDVPPAPPALPVISTPILSTTGVLRAAFERKLSSDIGLSLFYSYKSIPDVGHSEVFISLLNHAAFFAQGNNALVLEWVKDSGLGRSNWFMQRLARADGIVIKEIDDAIATQQAFYDPNHNASVGDLSHSDLADELGRRWFYENARFISKQSRWLLWDETRWQSESKLHHLSIIGSYLRDRSNELSDWMEEEPTLDEKTIRSVKAEIKVLKSAPMRVNIESIIRTDPRCTSLTTDFDAAPRVLGTPTGTVDLVTGVITPPRRTNYMTKQTAVSVVDGEPTQWLVFLNTIFSWDSSMVRFIQTLCGYMLTGLTVEEKLFFFYGTGANGKSKLLETVFYILGDYAKRAPASMLLEQRNNEHPTAMAGLQGARGVFASEVPSGKSWNEQVIKDSTGGDTITARLMRQDFFEFTPQFKLIVAGNHQPRLRNVDESVVRRMVMVPFEVTIEESKRDTHLGEKLKSEAGQILGWMIEGSVRYFNEGLIIPPRVVAASSAYIKNEDVIGEYIEEHLINTDCEKDKVAFSSIFDNYKTWIMKQGYNFNMTERQLKKAFKDRDYLIKRSNHVTSVHKVSAVYKTPFS